MDDTSRQDAIFSDLHVYVCATNAAAAGCRRPHHHRRRQPTDI